MDEAMEDIMETSATGHRLPEVWPKQVSISKVYILEQVLEKLKIPGYTAKTYDFPPNEVYATISFVMPPHRHVGVAETKTYSGDFAFSRDEAIDLAASAVLADLIGSGVVTVKDANCQQLLVVKRKLLYEESWKLINERNLPVAVAENAKPTENDAKMVKEIAKSASKEKGCVSEENMPGPSNRDMQFAMKYSRNTERVRRSLFNTP